MTGCIFALAGRLPGAVFLAQLLTISGGTVGILGASGFRRTGRAEHAVAERESAACPHPGSREGDNPHQLSVGLRAMLFLFFYVGAEIAFAG